MFGTEITIVTFLFLIIEVLILSSLILNWLSNPSDKSIIRFLTLTFVFIYYNLASGFFPDNNVTLLPLIAQNIFAYSSGIAVAIYFFYYLAKEMDIAVGGFSPKTFGTILIISFLLSYVLTYIVTKNQNIARIIFIGFPITLALSFSWKTIKSLLVKHKNIIPNTPFKTMYYASYFGLLCMCLFPICVAFGDYQNIEGLIVNSSFVFTAFAYIKRLVYHSKQKSKILPNEQSSKIKEYDTSNLTTREKEIFPLLFNESYTYTDISNELFIASKTVSKHASNIFKKNNVKTRKDFLNSLKNINN